MFCLFSSLHIMIIFYYIASIEMSSMQLLQNKTKTTVRYDAALLILSDGHLFIQRRPSQLPAAVFVMRQNQQHCSKK